jgi:hypothetical protein
MTWFVAIVAVIIPGAAAGAVWEDRRNLRPGARGSPNEHRSGMPRELLRDRTHDHRRNRRDRSLDPLNSRRASRGLSTTSIGGPSNRTNVVSGRGMACRAGRVRRDTDRHASHEQGAVLHVRVRDLVNASGPLLARHDRHRAHLRIVAPVVVSASSGRGDDGRRRGSR